MKFSLLIFLLIPVLVLISSPSVEAEIIKQTMEGSMDLEITYPESSVIGRTLSISILIENNGWEDKQEISMILSSSDGSFVAISDNKIFIDKLSAGGSYGATIDFQVSSEANTGSNFLNVLYSQVLLRNNEEPQAPTQSNIAIPLIIKDEPMVTIHTTTPESIFENAEFPFTVEILSEDVELNDVSIQIIPPKDIEFRGETKHTFSSIQQDVPVSVTSQIITPQEKITTEHKIPFQIIVEYVDDIGQEKTDSITVSLLLRPRTFMEITTDGGIWIGGFFLAPYVSIGTIIGIPAGTLLSLALRRSMMKKKKKVKKSKK